MTQEEIIKNINEVIKDTFVNIIEDNLNEDSLELMSKNGILDSINILNFIVNIEEKFKISIIDEDLNFDCFTNTKDLSEFINLLMIKNKK
jgi:acyl carrier protein